MNSIKYYLSTKSTVLNFLGKDINREQYINKYIPLYTLLQFYFCLQYFNEFVR